VSEHTPGPWDVKPDLIGYVEASIADDKGASISPIAVVFEHSEYGRSLPAKANTRLIAAAPDLLAALEGLLAAFDSDFHDLMIAKLAAKAAITQATGGAK